jgi:hypothetical protein
VCRNHRYSKSRCLSGLWRVIEGPRDLTGLIDLYNPIERIIQMRLGRAFSDVGVHPVCNLTRKHREFRSRNEDVRDVDSASRPGGMPGGEEAVAPVNIMVFLKARKAMKNARTVVPGKAVHQ